MTRRLLTPLVGLLLGLLVLLGCGASAQQVSTNVAQEIAAICQDADAILPLTPVEQATCAAATSVADVIALILNPRIAALRAAMAAGSGSGSGSGSTSTVGAPRLLTGRRP
jgi:hypothetical protein